jgi:hypothetical protein
MTISVLVFIVLFIMTKSYLAFELIEHKSKTDIYLVKNNLNNSVLGKISWYISFRKYCFFPSFNTVFDSNCLEDIINFMGKLMNERKIKK